MDQYVLGLLKRGPKWAPQATDDEANPREGHMASIRRMGAAGILIVAGPFEDNTELREMFICKYSVEQAPHEASQDPAFQSGRLILKLHPWFAAKGLKGRSPEVVWLFTIAALLAVPAVLAETPARVYVYAQRETAARSWKVISLDGAPVAKLKAGYLFAAELRHGQHTFSVEDGVPVVIETGAASESWVRLDWSYSLRSIQGGGKPTPVLSPVNPDRAVTETEYLTCVDRRRILDRKAISPADPRQPRHKELRTRPAQ